MRALEVLARAALGWVFVQAGVGVLRKPHAPATKAAPVLALARKAAPRELPDDLVLVRMNAATQVGAGTALILDVTPRLASAALIGSLVPTTFGGHRFWEIDPGPERNTQRNHFLKNISIIGGLLHVIVAPRHRREERG